MRRTRCTDPGLARLGCTDPGSPEAMAAPTTALLTCRRAAWAARALPVDQQLAPAAKLKGLLAPARLLLGAPRPQRHAPSPAAHCVAPGARPRREVKFDALIVQPPLYTVHRGSQPYRFNLRIEPDSDIAVLAAVRRKQP